MVTLSAVVAYGYISKETIPNGSNALLFEKARVPRGTRNIPGDPLEWVASNTSQNQIAFGGNLLCWWIAATHHIATVLTSFSPRSPSPVRFRRRAGIDPWREAAANCSIFHRVRLRTTFRYRPKRSSLCSKVQGGKLFDIFVDSIRIR
jgi:hypothetical protein